MEVSGRDVPAEEVGRLARLWWLFLLTGIGWIVISFIILAMKPGSVATISFVVGFVLLGAGINELVTSAAVESWRWTHVAIGVLFLVAGFLAFVQPLQTFSILAVLIGWYLLFKGLFGVMLSIMERDELRLWGLLLGASILEMLLGLWALGYPGRSAWLVIVWTGIGALLHGVGELVMAFKLRGVDHHPPLATA
jgi:uncharacterized membrane protein HdeD (DUF308 family)